MRHERSNHLYNVFPNKAKRTFTYTPYSNGAFTSPNPNRTYIKLLKVIAENDGKLNRKEILVKMGYFKTVEGVHRGYHSNLFSTLVHDDYIDYSEKTWKYHITETGKALLRKAGITSLTINIPL